MSEKKWNTILQENYKMLSIIFNTSTICVILYVSQKYCISLHLFFKIIFLSRPHVCVCEKERERERECLFICLYVCTVCILCSLVIHLWYLSYFQVYPLLVGSFSSIGFFRMYFIPLIIKQEYLCILKSRFYQSYISVFEDNYIQYK